MKTDQSLFLELLPCDPTKRDKTCAATAEKLMNFIQGKLGLQKYQKRMNFTSDDAIACAIHKAMAKVGMPDLENRWSNCCTHDGNNIHKRGKSNKATRMRLGDGKGEL